MAESQRIAKEGGEVAREARETMERPTLDTTAIRKRKSKVYVTKRWHVLAIINKILPFTLYKRM